MIRYPNTCFNELDQDILVISSMVGVNIFMVSMQSLRLKGEHGNFRFSIF
ncbi:hypothetical protein BACCELL_05474 [Bacteroides cellulosilyticus DSM 14838]|uniref:Uncharacterized protein n=1 Tax=Bacteroides cellulosilyticus DSM 14838 TaxID=537012 RepID=E2NMC9_9BACE|nr:hypothetical protein BACCELL_05474 [Bacteroides cellulosilyticus DSM 14838]